MRRGTGHLARILLGSIFLFSGIAKGLTTGEFTRQVAGYSIIGPQLSEIVAPSLIVLEIALGIALVCAARPALATLAAIVLLLVFVGIEAYGLMVGRTEACGCFGAYVQRTPAQVIGEDLLFIALGGLSLWGLRGWAGMKPGRALAALTAALVISTTYVVASPSLPFFNIPFLTRLTPGATLADLDLARRLPELAVGRHLVALFDVRDPKSASLASALNELASAPGAFPILGLTPATEQDIDAFRWTAIPGFEVKRLDPEVIPILYRKLPRFFVLDAGRVAAVYDGAPPGTGDLLSWGGS